MSTKKAGVLTTSGEWAKHLRRWGKKVFWRRERRRARREARQEVRREAA